MAQTKSSFYPLYNLTLYWGWLLALPLWGPVLGKISTSNTFFACGAVFMGSSIISYLLFAYPIPYRDSNSCRIAALVMAIFSFLTLITDGWLLLPIFCGLGFFSTIPVLGWAEQFFLLVPAKAQPLSLGLIIAGSNGILFLFVILSPYLSRELLLLLAAVPLLLSQLKFSLPVAAPKEKTYSQKTLSSRFYTFIFLFYLLGGLLYNTIYQTIPPYAHQRITLLPYIAAAAILGWLASRGTVERLARYASQVMGVAFTLYILLPGNLAHWSFHFFAMIAFALADLFLFLKILGTGNLKQFAKGLSASFLAILLGCIFTRTHYSSLTKYPLKLSALGSGLLFLSLGPLLDLLGTKEKVDPLSKLTADLANPLTARELELLELLAKGYSQSEIQKLVHLSEGTVKTHLRHIYQKTGFANQRELLSYLLEKQK